MKIEKICNKCNNKLNIVLNKYDKSIVERFCPYCYNSRFFVINSEDKEKKYHQIEFRSISVHGPNLKFTPYEEMLTPFGIAIKNLDEAGRLIRSLGNKEKAIELLKIAADIFDRERCSNEYNVAIKFLKQLGVNYK